MNCTTIGMDTSKSVFELAVSTDPGRVSERHRISRGRLVKFFATRSASTVVMESCGSTHHWGRRLRELGHQVVLLPPMYTRPYVQRQKTDRTDAKGLLEAYRNEEIRAVPVKSVEQQAVASLHRSRSAWVSTRVRRINTVRGLLREFGITIPQGAKLVVPAVRILLEDSESAVPMVLRPSLAAMLEEIRALEKRIGQVEIELNTISRGSTEVRRLLTIPGIGVLAATALVAFVGDFRRFPTGRHLASYLGLTPRIYATGLTCRLGKISKQGDVYLRLLLAHGARSFLLAARRRKAPDRLQAWALRVWDRRGWYTAVVAVANKLARIVWVVGSRDEDYRTFSKEA